MLIHRRLPPAFCHFCQVSPTIYRFLFLHLDGERHRQSKGYLPRAHDMTTVFRFEPRPPDVKPLSHCYFDNGKLLTISTKVPRRLFSVLCVNFYDPGNVVHRCLGGKDFRLLLRQKWKEKHHDVLHVKRANQFTECLHRMFLKRKAGQIPACVCYCFVDNGRRDNI